LQWPLHFFYWSKKVEITYKLGYSMDKVFARSLNTS
jgi:hypothetical protein